MFTYFLAEQLGFASPRHLLSGAQGPLYGEEVTYWRAYYRIQRKEAMARKKGAEPAQDLEPEAMAGLFSGWARAVNAGKEPN